VQTRVELNSHTHQHDRNLPALSLTHRHSCNLYAPAVRAVRLYL